MIPYGKQNISQDDVDAVVKVLQSDFITQGPQVPLFEQATAKRCNVEYAVAVNSATSALHIANLALGVGKNDIVWTSPITFVATSNSALYCGAIIDFVDIDLSSGNMSVEALEQKLTIAKKNKTLPKVVIPVHLAGQSCDMKKIHKLGQEYGFSIIEDASHAVGGQYQNTAIGSCLFSDITVFSFHPVKIITSAEGGMALTNNHKLQTKMKRLRSHGIVSDQAEMTEQSHGPWYYQQIDLGFNYRMTDIQSALGLSQLNQLDHFIEKRNKLAQDYDQSFVQTKLTPLTPHDNNYSAYHLYIVLLPEADAILHSKIISQLRAKNIFAHVHYIPVYSQPYYQQLCLEFDVYPKAEDYYHRAITLPLHPELSNEDQNYIIDTIKGLI
jgi:UDP-4-amino-4,6-dideoxy-N-acetyl-beta-L-altrosamine transaminase